MASTCHKNNHKIKIPSFYFTTLKTKTKFHFMMKKALLTSLSILGCINTLSARTWTSSDGTKSFEADYIGHTDSAVSIIKDSKKITFPLNLLSEADQAWTRAHGTETANTASAPKNTLKKETVATTSSSSLTQNINKHLKKFDGKSFKEHNLDNKPEYYLVYFSASW